MRIKTGDQVLVIAGKDKGKDGKVLKVLPQDNRVIVENINIVKKHQKPSQANQTGGIVEVEAPIHVSNVALIDPKSGEATRVGVEEKDGKKVRVARKSGEALDK